MSNKVQTGFLFAEPSFLSGAARTLDLFGLFDVYNRSNTPLEADTRAIASDWIITGQDVQDAIGQFESENEAA
jgi:hypothetical protein